MLISMQEEKSASKARLKRQRTGRKRLRTRNSGAITTMGIEGTAEELPFRPDVGFTTDIARGYIVKDKLSSGCFFGVDRLKV